MDLKFHPGSRAAAFRHGERSDFIFSRCVQRRRGRSAIIDCPPLQVLRIFG
jgi:hypothetical protein